MHTERVIEFTNDTVLSPMIHTHSLQENASQTLILYISFDIRQPDKVNLLRIGTSAATRGRPWWQMVVTVCVITVM